MQLTPDWTRRGTAEKLEAYVGDLKIKGPGWMLSDTDSVLFLPNLPHNDPTRWDQKQPEDMEYTMYVFNCPFNQTIFGGSTLPPIREDTRTLKRY